WPPRPGPTPSAPPSSPRSSPEPPPPGRACSATTSSRRSTAWTAPPPSTCAARPRTSKGVDPHPPRPARRGVPRDRGGRRAAAPRERVRQLSPPCRAAPRASGRADPPVELLHAVALLLADRLEDQPRDLPLVLLGRDVRAVLHEAGVEELERVARLVHLVERVDQVLARHVLAEQVEQADRLGRRRAAGAQPGVAQVVE